MDRFDKMFLGHTTTKNEGAAPIIHLPKKDGAKTIQIDCGAGYKGRLCLWNIDTDEYHLSDYTNKHTNA